MAVKFFLLRWRKHCFAPLMIHCWSTSYAPCWNIALSLSKEATKTIFNPMWIAVNCHCLATALCHLHPKYSTAYPQRGAICSRDEQSWLVAAVSEKLKGSTLLLLLHSLPHAAPPGQHLPLHIPKSLTSGSFSYCQSLVLPRLMVRYSWWIGSLGVTFMAPNFTHSIFDPLSCFGTQWVGDKVMIN